MKRFVRLMMAVFLTVTLIPVASSLSGCSKDESKDILKENYNEEVEDAMRNNSRRQQMMEDEDESNAIAQE